MDEYLGNLNPAQLQPVLATEGAVLVLAGAGSGKTRVLTHRIAYLVERKGVSPYNILAITFTNKAANEMRERLITAVQGAGDMWISTIHSMCARILKSNADRLGYTSKFSIYTTQDKDRLLKRIIETSETDDEYIKKNLGFCISTAKNLNLSPEEYAREFKNMHKVKQISQLFYEYNRELKRCNSMDFDDLLTLTYKLLSENADVLEYYQQKFKYIHIDEFQDTNRIQYLIFKLLSAKHGNIFAVGDDDQSIYGWRGAEVDNMFNFEKDFANASVYKLEQNYRSTKKILAAANQIISLNNSRYKKELYTENQEGVKVEGYVAYDETQEAYYVASTIKALMRAGYKYKDFAVLMRINALSRTFEQEFLKYNIPYKVFGGFKFFERKEIKDIIAYFRIINNPYDEESILRVINTPKRGIGDAAIRQLKGYAFDNSISLYDAIIEIEKSALSRAVIGKIANFRDILSDINYMAETMTIAEFAEALVERVGFKNSDDGRSEDEINRLLNIQEFLASVAEFEKNNKGAALKDFLDSVSLISELDESIEDDNYVSLATVHSAKGLEYNCVFIVGMEEKVFPIIKDYDDMEEERRLMYVAITRARERLYLTRSRSRFSYGERNYMLPSRYYEELFPSQKPVAANTQSATAVIRETASSSTDFVEFEKGATVVHKVFGEGIIISTKGEGKSKMVDVAFKGIGVKTLTLQFAPLKIKE